MSTHTHTKSRYPTQKSPSFFRFALHILLNEIAAVSLRPMSSVLLDGFSTIYIAAIWFAPVRVQHEILNKHFAVYMHYGRHQNYSIGSTRSSAVHPFSRHFRGEWRAHGCRRRVACEWIPNGSGHFSILYSPSLLSLLSLKRVQYFHRWLLHSHFLWYGHLFGCPWLQF